MTSYYDPFKGKILRWEDLLQGFTHGREGAYSYIAADLASHPLMDADALRPFPDELLNFELNLINDITKPFALHKPDAPKGFSTDVDCVGIDDRRAYIFLHSEGSVYSLESGATDPLRIGSSTHVAMFGDVQLYCSNGKLYQVGSAVPEDILGPTKIVADPLSSDSFFIRSQDGDDLSQLNFGRIRDGKLEHVLVTSGIEDFDVSGKFLLFVVKGKAAVYARHDSEIHPLFEKNLAARARVFVDDEFFYEFLPKSQTLYVFGKGKPVQQVKMVANVFKSTEVVIEYIDGTIGTVGRPPVFFETPPIGAVANGKTLVTWTSLDGPPEVHDLEPVDLPLIRRCDNLALKLKLMLDARQAQEFMHADQLVAQYEKRMDAIISHADDLIDGIPDSFFFICLEVWNDGREDLAFSDAAEDQRTFELLAGDGRLASSVDNGNLSGDTLIKAVGPLAALLQKDVSVYAHLVVDVLLALPNTPPPENLVLLLNNVKDLQPTIESAPELTQTLRLIERLIISLRAPFA